MPHRDQHIERIARDISVDRDVLPERPLPPVLDIGDFMGDVRETTGVIDIEQFLSGASQVSPLDLPQPLAQPDVFPVSDVVTPQQPPFVEPDFEDINFGFSKGDRFVPLGSSDVTEDVRNTWVFGTLEEWKQAMGRPPKREIGEGERLRGAAFEQFAAKSPTLAGVIGTPAFQTATFVIGLTAIGLGLWSGLAPLRAKVSFNRLPERQELIRVANANNVSRNSQVFKDAENALRSAFNLHKGGAPEAAQQIMSRFYASYGRTMPRPTGAPARPPTPFGGLVPRAPQTGVFAVGGRPGELTKVLWDATLVAQRVVNAQSAGLVANVGSKSWEALTSNEKQALSQVIPTIEPTEGVTPITEPVVTGEVSDINQVVADLNLLREEQVWIDTMQTIGSSVVSETGRQGIIVEPARDYLSDNVQERQVQVGWEDGSEWVMDSRDLVPSQLQKDVAEITHGQPITKFPSELQPPVTPEVPAEPITATQQVEAIQEQGRTAPESVPPEQAEFAHKELAAPDGPKPPKPPGVVTGEAREPGDIMREIMERGFDERPDQILLRLHEGMIGSEGTRTNLTVKGGSEKLKKEGIGIWRRAHLIPKPADIPKLDELYIALHNPGKVDTGEIKIPERFENIYAELRTLTDWEQAARVDFDPEMATVKDYFYRGWKPPEGAFADVQQGRPLVKTPTFKKPRVNATYQEMRDAGFEPLMWNPYEQWGISRMQGVKYREQMELVAHLKGMGEEFIKPHDGGSIPKGWRVPEVGPAFEGKPFAIEDPVNGKPTVMFSRRWIVPDKIANSLENIYGKRPNLQNFVVAGKTIDPLSIIDALTFIPKRAKLFLSFFQQIDFLTRAGGNSWARGVDELLAGNPLEALKAPMRFPKAAMEILHANFSPTARKKLAKQLDDTTPLVKGRPGINFKGISEAGLSTRDVTIFPADMDKLVHEVATETGALSKIPRAIADLESAMRRGLFEGVYPAAIMTSIKNNIAPMTARQFPSLNDAQINGMIAREANTLFSTIPASQSVIQNRVLRESLRRLFFSIGESEGLLRQATGAVHGPNVSFWRKHWIGTWLFLITTASIIHYASTREPLPIERYSPIAKNNWGPLPFGYNTEFAAPTLPFKGRGGAELTLDLAGQMDTAFRILNPVNFITSRESVLVRAIQNQVTGTDFYGAPIDDVGPGGIVSRISQLMHDLFAPIGVGGITGELARQGIPGAEEIIPRGEERLGITGLALQATGLNIRAETTRNLLDRFARESDFLKADGTPVETWNDLEPFQKKELSTNEDLQTELGLRSNAAVERQQLKAAGFATLDDIDQERIVRGEALVTEYLGELMEANAFRDEVTLLKREMSARKAQVDEDFQLFEETGKLPTDPNKRALVQYYNTFELAKRASGVIDWNVQEAVEKHFRKTWTPAQEAYVDRNTGLTEWGPLMAEYHQAVELLKPYWEVPKGSKQVAERRLMRLTQPEIDAALIKWYGYKPSTGGSGFFRQWQ